MTKAQALKRMEKLYGKRAVIQDCGPKAATTPQQREDARRQLAILRAAPTKENVAERKALTSVALMQRYDVGCIYTIPGIGSGMRITGSGDSWDEAVAAAEAYEKRG